MISNLLHGQRLRLNALGKPDLPLLVLWEEHLLYLRLLNSNLARRRSEADLAEWIDQFSKAQDQIVLAIRLLEDNKLIGVLGFGGLEWTNQVAWLFIGIGDANYWGQGYGYEATQLALAYAFQELNLHR